MKIFISQVKYDFIKMPNKKKIKKRIAKNNTGLAKIATLTTKSISSAFSNYKKKRVRKNSYY